ncbi:MAG: hypothetical protein ACREE5_10720 [Acetobacteraceae bacterium]
MHDAATASIGLVYWWEAANDARVHASLGWSAQKRGMPAPTDFARRRYSWHLYLAFALLGAGITLLGDVHDWPVVLHGGLIDPDSYMRLLRILQGLKAGHLTNVVTGDDSGTPLILEWSRLLDGFLVLLAAPLAPFVGWRDALFGAGIASGPLFGGLLSATLAFAARPLSSRSWLWTAVVPGLLLTGIRGFNEFGVVHYHTLQLALVALAAGFAVRGAFTAVGIAAGFALWVTPETMPFALVVFVALGWTWCLRPIGVGVARAGAAFFCVVAIAVLLDPPHGRRDGPGWADRGIIGWPLRSRVRRDGTRHGADAAGGPSAP